MYYSKDNDQTKINPTFHSLDIGDNAQFDCTSQIQVKWLFERGPLPQNVVKGISVDGEKFWLYIYSAQLSNAGTYTCHGEDDLVVFVATGKVTVYGEC